MTTTAETIEAVAVSLGLTMTAEFVPWSKSRNAGEKQPSLNWKVTLHKGRGRLHKCNSGHEWTAPVTLSPHTPNISGEATAYCPLCGGRAVYSSPVSDGREVLTTDYMAGSGHCPAYKASVKELGGRDSLMRDEAIRWECENGKAARVLDGTGRTFPGKPILPKLADVLYSLCADAGAIDYRDFDEWAGNYGYDADSRKAEAIYRVCLEIGRKLRSALGEDGLKQLREACQDY